MAIPLVSNTSLPPNTLSGFVNIVVGVPSGCPALNITKVTVFSQNSTNTNRTNIGNAFPGANLYTWTLTGWDTKTLPNGPLFLSADVYIKTSTSTIATPITTNSTITYTIYNPALPQATGGQTGGTGTGTTTTNTDSTSGAGSGQTTTTTNNDSGTSTGTATVEPAVQVGSSQVKVSSQMQACIVEKGMTLDRYKAIASGKSRPTDSELTKIQTCFALVSYILPTNFAPVDPVKVKNLGSDKVITISKPINVTKKDAYGNKKETLKLSGKAKSKSTVYLYIFSDPLVITTSADSDGNWQYTLEDPLNPGNHEVYAVVDKGDGSYKRSDPMSFIISTAGASAVNPNGLSLNLSKVPTATPAQSTGNLVFYIAGSAAVLVVVLVGLYVVVRIRKKKSSTITPIYIDQPNSQIPDATSPFVDKPPELDSVEPTQYQPIDQENNGNSTGQEGQ